MNPSEKAASRANRYCSALEENMMSVHVSPRGNRLGEIGPRREDAVESNPCINSIQTIRVSSLHFPHTFVVSALKGSIYLSSMHKCL